MLYINVSLLLFIFMNLTLGIADVARDEVFKKEKKT